MLSQELTGILYSAGLILIFVGILILAMNLVFQKKKRGRSEAGGFILIGPFPIVFGTSSRMMKIMFVIALMFIAVILLTNFLRT